MKKEMHKSLRPAGAGLCLALTLGGCGVVLLVGDIAPKVGSIVGIAQLQHLQATDLRAVREKRAAIVLIRAAATQDGTRPTVLFVRGAMYREYDWTAHKLPFIHAYAEGKTRDGDQGERRFWNWSVSHEVFST